MSLPNKAPQRTCVACGAIRDQAQLVRIVQSANANLSIGNSSRERGRGAYICPSRQCWERALKGTRLEHALRAKLTNENRAALLQYSSTLKESDSNG
jgi:predicted RNA-binding protein YlxR (DUF448 family)